MTTSSSAKADLRRHHLSLRDATSPEWRIEVAASLAALAPALAIEPGTIVSGFMPIRSEIDLRPLMFALAADGARLCVPVVTDRTTIVFRELKRGAPLVATGFGTVGPDESAEVLDPAVMLVPLSVFDSRGNRIGYGAGHYDRAISRLAGKGMVPRLIGAAFDCQEASSIPAEPHDVPLDAIITESGLRKFERKG